MIGMSVRVDDRIQTPAIIGEDRQVALDLVAQGVDNDGLAGSLTDHKIGFALAPIEFAKDHSTFSTHRAGAWLPPKSILDRIRFRTPTHSFDRRRYAVLRRQLQGIYHAQNLWNSILNPDSYSFQQQAVRKREVRVPNDPHNDSTIDEDRVSRCEDSEFYLRLEFR